MRISDWSSDVCSSDLENISPDQVIDPGGLLCFSALWEGEKTPLCYSEWEHGHHDMVVALHKLLSEADAVVTYNGDRYDIPKAMGEFVLEGLMHPPTPASIEIGRAQCMERVFQNV